MFGMLDPPLTVDHRTYRTISHNSQQQLRHSTFFPLHQQSTSSLAHKLTRIFVQQALFVLQSVRPYLICHYILINVITSLILSFKSHPITQLLLYDNLILYYCHFCLSSISSQICHLLFIFYQLKGLSIPYFDKYVTVFVFLFL